MTNTITSPVELREADGERRLHATIVQEGRAARGGRAELFAPNSIQWPSNGIAIKTVHLGQTETRAMPTRRPDGRIQVAVKATPGLLAAYEGGKRSMSIEFRSIQDDVTTAGVREIQGALLEGAALVASPEYGGTRVELRSRRFRGCL